MRVIQPVWNHHKEVAERREHGHDGHDVRLVTTTSEVPDEHHERHVDDITRRHYQTGLGAPESEPTFQRPCHSTRVHDADHPQPEHTSNVDREQQHAPTSLPLPRVFRYRHIRRPGG